MLTYMSVPRSGAQYIHYAFGLLERTNVFSPDQAVIDDAHIGIIKHFLKEPDITADGKEKVSSMIKEVMDTGHRTYMYHLPLPTRENVYVKYPLESAGGALKAANEKLREIENKDRNSMSKDMLEKIKKIPGVIDKTLK
jgi:trimethylamine---corrinoid protein Co-methyltransferase